MSGLTSSLDQVAAISVIPTEAKRSGGICVLVPTRQNIPSSVSTVGWPIQAICWLEWELSMYFSLPQTTSVALSAVEGSAF